MDVKLDLKTLDPLMFQFESIAALEDELEEKQPTGYTAHLNDFIGTEEISLLEYIKQLGRPESDQLIMDYIKSNRFVKGTLEEVGILLKEMEDHKKAYEELVALTEKLDDKFKEIKLNEKRCWFRQQFRYWSTDKSEQEARVSEFLKLKSRAKKIETSIFAYAKKVVWTFEKFQAINVRTGSQSQDLDFLPKLAGHCLTGTIEGPIVRASQAHNLTFEGVIDGMKRFKTLDNDWTLWLISEVGRGFTARFMVTLPFFWCCPMNVPTKILSFGTIWYVLKEFMAYGCMTSSSGVEKLPKDFDFRIMEPCMIFYWDILKSKWFNFLWLYPSIRTIYYLRT